MNPFHGWLVINKPLNVSSAAVVNKVKHAVQKVKIGHAGTLDPLAEGVLPLALGEATKVIPFLVNADKEYVFEVTWGEQRATDDSAGDVLKSTPKRPRESEIRELLSSFCGHIMQLPPLYCAKKIEGRRAYALARQGEEHIDLKPSAIEIQHLELLKSEKDHTLFRVVCGKGTYVRALARDLGEKLGCYGYASKITRTRVGPFKIESAISLENLAESIKIGIVPRLIQPLQVVLGDIPATLVNDQQAQQLKLGQKVVGLDAAMQPVLNPVDVCIFHTKTREPVALAQFIDGQLRPRRVFNL